MAGPLDGIRVLDLTHYAVGPWACTLLGQLGADVIKVEASEGDFQSRYPPPFKNGITTVYIAVNLNKTCAALDLRDAEAQRAVREIARTADILVENHRPGFLDRRGLGYQEVSRLNPRLVYCSSSGYGSRGPYRDMGSTDPFGQAVSGFASVSGPAGGPGEGVKGGAPADLGTSIYIAAGCLAAFYRREQTGRGQKVEISQMQASIALTTSRAMEYFASGANPVPMGSGIAHVAPSRTFRAADGKYVNISALDEATWRRLAKALELPGLVADPRFDSNASRVAHREELDALLEEAVAARPAEEWLSRLERAQVPCGRPLIYNQIRIDPQVKAFGMLEEIETHWGTLRFAGVPWHFSRTPASVTAARRPGEDTEKVLAMAGPARVETVPEEQAPAAASNGRAANTGPLAGLRVVDLTQGYIGYCGMLLGDLGAEVLKVEPPEGDYLRRLGPPFIAADSAAFVGVNRGKKSVILDWRNAEVERKRLMQAIGTADVLLTDLYPDEAGTLGLDYESVGRTHPRVIYCSITPVGDSGPSSNKRATELEIQGMAAYWRYVGNVRAAPLRVGLPFAAVTSSIFAFQGIMAALVHRGRTGQAQKVSVSQVGSLIAMQTILFASESEPDEWLGHCLSAYRLPQQGFRAKDGAMHWGFMGNAEGPRQLYVKLGLTQFLDDPRFGGNDLDRREQEQILRPIFEEALKDRTVEEVIALVRECGGQAMPYHTFASLAKDPQAIEMGMIAEMPHPALGVFGDPTRTRRRAASGTAHG